MKLIHKAKKYYREAYTAGHFPHTRQLFFGETKVFAYYGFLGDKNFGDELVFESAKRLFYPHILLPVRRTMPLMQAFYAKACTTRISGLVVGGGTLIGPLWEPEFFESLVDLPRPVYVHGTGVRGRIERFDGWKHMLGGEVYGGVRGPRSVENIADILSGMQITGDAAFAICDSPTPIGPACSERILINCGTHSDFMGQDNTRTSLGDFIEYASRKGFEVQFLPLHTIDLNLAMQLKRTHPELTILKIPSTYREARAHFVRSTFAVGERLHFTVMAILCGCPFLSINYGEKHHDLLASLGLTDSGVHPSHVSHDSIRMAFEERERSFDWTSIFSKVH